MKLEKIELWHVALPLRTPWRTAYGSDADIHSVIVRILAEGEEGWGEATPFEAPTYSPQTAHCAFYILKEFFIPRLLGLEFSSADKLLERLSCFKGNTFAKAAIETAWWDLRSKMLGMPLWKVLGGTRDTIPVGADFQIYDDTKRLLEDIAIAVDKGYPRIKLKVGPEHDIDVVAAVRNAFPDLTLHIDCNSGYDFKMHKDLFRELDHFDLAMFEQPLQHDDLVDHARLQELVRTPICLDESITSVRSFELALRLKSCQVVNVKPGRVGGLAPAKRIHDMAKIAGLTAWVGGMLESGIGVGIAAALASLPGFTYPADIFPSDRIHQFDITRPSIQLDEKCCLHLGNMPGLQFEVDMDRLETVTVERY